MAGAWPLEVMAKPVDQHLGDLGGEQVRLVLAELAAGGAGANEGGMNLAGIEGHAATVTFYGLAGQGKHGLGGCKLSHLVSCFVVNTLYVVYFFQINNTFSI
jgi:hypothetical protein